MKPGRDQQEKGQKQVSHHCTFFHSGPRSMMTNASTQLVSVVGMMRIWGGRKALPSITLGAAASVIGLPMAIHSPSSPVVG